MAPRGRSVTASEDAHSDRSYDSSPDPLAISFDDNIPSAHRKPTPRKPLIPSSPSKQQSRLNASEMMFSSPSKSMTLSTPRGNGASPWRIKVTVQAEPEDDGEHAESPSVKRVTRTKTTTVPLKDPDASSPVKRPRGRPRKSDIGSTPRAKRRGTPIKRPAQFSSPTKIMQDSESGAADVDTDIPPRKRRGRPRKSAQPPTQDTDATEEPGTSPHSTREVTPLPTASSKSGGLKKNTRFADITSPDVENVDDVMRASPESEPSPSIGTPAQQNLRNAMRARRGTPHVKKVAIIESDEDEEGSDVLTPTSGEEENALPESQHLSATGDEENVLTPSESSAQSSDSSDSGSDATGDDGAGQVAQEFEDDDETQGQQFVFDEGTTRMPDDTTMLDSETFSMISVESLQSNGARASPSNTMLSNATAAPRPQSSLRNEYLGPSTNATSEPEPTTRQEQVPAIVAPEDTASTDTVRPKLSRHVTPATDSEVPSAPPVLLPVLPAPTKSPSPTLGRAVTAGVALQGLLDPDRLTPEVLQNTPQAKRGSLDDLFRGFSSGTRKDLQAGLRLGEQLAQGGEDNAPGHSSPTRGPSTAAPKEGVFRTQRKYRESRLLTPEDQDHVITAAEPAVAASDVQYPTLNVEETEKAPLSPARSESAMSWQANTPPRASGSPVRQDSAMNDVQEEGPADAPAEVPAEKPAHEDFGDIWQEEASRSVISINQDEVPTEKSPEVHDLFTDADVVRPARGRTTRTWRRRRMNEAAESRQEPAATRTEPAVTQQAEDKAPEEQPKQANVPNARSEESDDSGMFFQSNVPEQKRPSRFERRRPRRQETEKVNIAEIIEQGESFVPSSPPVVAKKASPPTKPNPFLDTPPRFQALMSSPKKSSPLRRELHSGDISTSSVQQFEESTLPVAQSSPFHTVVDGDSKISAASDQRQFRMEMEGDTASTIVRVREEANEYLDAYEPQERSLNEITEVTEPSRTQIDRSLLPSSPPKMQRRFEQRLLSARKPSPLSKTVQRPDDEHVPSRQESARAEEPQIISSSPEPSSSEESEASSRAGTQPETQPDLASSALATSHFIQQIPHPILSRMTPLPKVEPWTRTHYKALDKLYAMHLKHPALFCPFNVPPTPLSITNGQLLRRFLADNGNLPYVGAVFHAWGYSMVMTAELVVLCSVFMDVMNLKSEAEYESVTGKRLQVGDCAPGRLGDWISGEDVLQRLATVVMGESVRRDERAGLEIDRSRGLQIEWPQRR